MKFTLEIDTDNEDREIGPMLRKVVAQVESGRTGGRVVDVNGNAVGKWEYEGDLEDEE